MRNAVTQEFGPVPDTARYYKVGWWGLGMGVLWHLLVAAWGSG